MFGYGFWLRSAHPGWGLWCVCVGLGFPLTPQILAPVLGCVYLCACSASTPPLLAGVCGVCVLARVLALSHHLWRGCVVWTSGCWMGFFASPRQSWRGVEKCVFVRVLRQYPAIPGRGLRCVCSCNGFGFTAPFVAGACGVAFWVWDGVFPSARQGWRGVAMCLFVWRSTCTRQIFRGRVQCGCVRLGWGFGCNPPCLAGVLRCVCLCACFACTPPALPWAPGACVSVRSLAFNPPVLAQVFVHVCMCARSPCTPPFLARVCGMALCAWVRVSAAPCHFWLGCWGVCVRVPAPPAPHPTWLGCAVCVCVFWFRWASPRHPGWGVVVCVYVCALCLYPASPGCCLWCLCLGLGFGFHPAIPGWAPRVFLFVSAHRLYPTKRRWGVRCGCVFSRSGWLRPATSGGGVGVCVYVCALRPYPASPRWGWWCLCLGLGFGFHPAIPGSGPGVYVFVCAHRLRPT